MLVSTGAAIFMIVSAFGFSATALILIILAGIKPVERHLFADRRQRTITLLIDRQGASLLAVEAAIEETGLRPQHTLIQRGDRLEEDRVQIALNHAPNKMLLPLAERLRQISGVREISDSG
jgi:putative Mg2+ transporter-C (MgtC) family protein